MGIPTCTLFQRQPVRKSAGQVGTCTEIDPDHFVELLDPRALAGGAPLTMTYKLWSRWFEPR